MADSSAYNKVTEVNPQLAAALYQYNVLSNAKPANEIDPMLLQQNAFQEQISRTVYIGNLNPTISEEELIKLFSTCGVINLAKIACEGMGLKADAGTRFGFIEFQDRKGAEAAPQLDGLYIGGRPIRVGPSNGPIIQPTAYGPGAETMRNKPPLYKIARGGFVILDEKAEADINRRIDNRMKSVLDHLSKKLEGKTKGSDTAKAPVASQTPQAPRNSRDAQNSQTSHPEQVPQTTQSTQTSQSAQAPQAPQAPQASQAPQAPPAPPAPQPSKGQSSYRSSSSRHSEHRSSHRHHDRRDHSRSRSRRSRDHYHRSRHERSRSRSRSRRYH